uniref:NADH-ubiquinone oxidoreductase chain 6 n=1 Tax=Torleya mikhaili TaxID=2816379 RepID=A0A899IK44_9INSE|nr:NADH dehydrogenase subunit 6 [Torleya mikhaili]QSL98487.1 NADH dehydrogenase subunit 6 [Torleya mikhaili]
MSSSLLMMTLFTGSIMIFMTHPLAMGLILLVQTCLVSLLTGSMSSSFWFSYILFLVFLGGMLVLFIYMTSLASNEMFTISSMITSLFPGVLAFTALASSLMILFNFLNPSPYLNPHLHSNLWSSTLPHLISKLYNTFSSHLTILLAMYLFLTLIIVVHLTSFNHGPLRSYN